MFRGNEEESDKRKEDLGLGRKKKSFLQKQEGKIGGDIRGGRRGRKVIRGNRT